MKSSNDITKEADALKARLAALRKEARRMKRLEDQKAAEINRRERISFALSFVEMAKLMHLRDSSRTYYDDICEKLDDGQPSLQHDTS